MDQQVQHFMDNLHHTTTLLSTGRATVMGHVVDACQVQNLYGQVLVWGVFNVDKGKYKGKKLTNDATTEGVGYNRG